MVVFLSASAMVCQAMGATLTLEPVDAVNLTPHFTVLEDPSQKLTEAEVSTPAFDAQFKPATDPRRGLQLGTSTSAYWLKLEFFNPNAISYSLCSLQAPQKQQFISA